MELVAVARGTSRAFCEERALVLHAVGIGSQLAWDGEQWLLLVDFASEAAARGQLERYAAENPARASPPDLRTHRGAWVGSLVYALVLLGVGWAAGRHAGGYSWWEAGALHARAVLDGEWWRAVTALTLHVDIAHLVGNIGFGAVFGYLASQLLGPGIAWGSILASAVLANFATALLAPRDHVSIGASTAVFAALGLLASFSWRSRGAERRRWAYRWAPLIAGLALLAFTGAGGEHTDVLAHVLGFTTGVLAGSILAARRRQAPASAGVGIQGSVALAAGVLLIASWSSRSLRTQAEQDSREDRRRSGGRLAPLGDSPAESTVRVQHALGRLDLRVMTHVLEQRHVRLGDQLAIAHCEVRARHRVECSTDQRARNARGHERADPPLAMPATLGHVVDEPCERDAPAIVIDLPPHVRRSCSRGGALPQSVCIAATRCS
jgi:membrane associated rhomboid family serine protease